MKDTQEVITHIWDKYKAGVRHHTEKNLYAATERNYKFYEGDQWYGMPKGETLPCFNFIKPTVNYKVSMVAMNTMQIMFSPMEYTPESVELCELLNKYAAKTWERLKLDSESWQVILDAAVAGDSYLYFYDKALNCQIIQNTDIYFADEQQKDIQLQPYIIIAERRPVEDVKAEAKKNGIASREIANITADKPDETNVGDTTEVELSHEDAGKCTSLLYLSRNKDGDVIVCRSTKTVVYQKETTITNLKRYPIAALIWGPQLNSARGTGEVKPLIPNQFETNKLLARRCSSAAQNAFAKAVYQENLVKNPEDIGKLGNSIAIRGNGTPQDIRQIFDYIAPAPMSQEANMLQSDIITQSRELAGAGSAALGQIDPRRASGDAIMAVVDQSAIPMNMQTAAYRQFVEDIAHIMLAYWRVYSKETKGIEMSYLEKDAITNSNIIVTKHAHSADLNTEVSVKIDATATNPYSKLAEERTLEAALSAGHITFEEYVELLPYNSNSPKAGFSEVLEKRRRAAAAAPSMPMPGIPGAAPPQSAPAMPGNPVMM